MKDDASIFLPHGIDYLGFLNAKLRDLRGWATLLNELIQNADDPEDSTSFTVDVTDDALIVENNGLFRDCGAISSARCTYDLIGDGRTCCDFHAFRRVASGHKRQEEGTTGAFGIGFISVYQITDQPILSSGNWLWTLRPNEEESRRIEAKPQAMFQGTRFVLPWSKTASALRIRLGLEPVPDNIVDRMIYELREAMTLAAPFLKRLQTLELRKRGKTECFVSCVRDPAASEILIDVDGITRVWKRLDSDFGSEARQLHTKHPGQIEAKRRAGVTVAVSLDGLFGNGRLYATLPTEHEVGLPLLINADFFPSSDRKRILFDPDYQGDWNRAAIRAASKAVADALPVLRDSLKPVELWKLFESMKGLQRLAVGGKTDNVFASFWTSIQPKLKQEPFVLSSTKKWCSPTQIRLLQNAKDEALLLPLLEMLDQDIVDLNLQPFSTLLHDGEIGVKHFALDDLTAALIGVGLDRPVSLNKTPLWLRDANHRRQLGSVIEKLHDRLAKEAKHAAELRIKNCSLLLSTLGKLTPANQLRIGDKESRELFAEWAPDDYWASENNPEELLRWVDKFAVKDAIELLRRVGAEAIQKSYSQETRIAAKLIAWFAESRHVVAQSVELANALRTLAIWPSGAQLYPLNELSVPGGFKDPLSLAKLLDAAIAEQWPGFLIGDLHAKELTLETYLTDHVSAVFDNEDPSAVVRHELMKLLVTHSGVLLDNSKVAGALRSTPIVACTDGKFRCGGVVYFKTDMVDHILSVSMPIAVVSEGSNPSVLTVLSWLGVRSIPVAEDILKVIKTVVEKVPTQECRAQVQSIFRGLAEHWPLLTTEYEHLVELRNISWLPSSRTQAWHKPKDIFSVFRNYLFSSQAIFLDIPRAAQNRASQPQNNSLFDFLRIETNPPELLVVKHLLFMAEHKEPVNLEVYALLNQVADTPPINLLHGKKCLFLDNKTYIEPRKALWNAHRFGRFRVRLSPEWRRYQNLLTALGVRDEEPSAQDAVAVLQELSLDYADNRRLLNTDHDVLIYCWSLLSENLVVQSPDWTPMLTEKRIVANANHFLVKPSELFFDDRPGLVERFGEEIRRVVIVRPEVASKAMELVGVRLLSEVVTSELVECLDPVLDDVMASHLAERWALIRRVFATREKQSCIGDMTLAPQVLKSHQLAVVYRIMGISALAEEVTAYVTDDKKLLYVCADRKNFWLAVAKELAFTYFPSGGAGILASAIKDVLVADDFESARDYLNELGISEVDLALNEADDSAETGLGAGVPEDGMPFDNLVHRVETSATVGIPGTTDRRSERTVAPHHQKIGLGSSITPSSKTENINNSDEGSQKANHSGNSTQQTQSKGNRPKLRSYMLYGKENESEMSEDTKQHRDHTGKSGVAHVLALETQQGRFPKEMDHFNEGYDVESKDAAGNILRFIEIKSMSGPWDGYGVGLSSAQFRMARAKGKAFWLYVVEQATSNKPKIHRIQNPFDQVNEYRFDDGWQVVSETTTFAETYSLSRIVIANTSEPNGENEVLSSNEVLIT